MATRTPSRGSSKSKPKSKPAAKPPRKPADPPPRGRAVAESTAALVPDPRNPREIADANAAALGFSMSEFGDLAGITFNLRTGHLVAGHQRVSQIRAAHGELPVERLDAEHGIIRAPDGHTWPVRFVDWPAAKQRAANIAANSPTLAGAFTSDLSVLLAETKAESPDAYDALLFADLAETNAPTSPVDEDTPPEPQEAVVTRPGDLWTLGEHRLLCGDSTKPEDVAQVMGGEKAGALIADPPYGIDHDTDYRRFSGGKHSSRNYMARIAGDRQPFDPSPWLDYPAVVLWGFNCFSDKLPIGSLLVWCKRRDSQLGTFMSDCEVAWMKGGHGVYLMNHVWNGHDRQSERKEHYHPTQKPVAVTQWAIEMSKSDGSVFDPYLGSGTTLIAAENLGRRCFGIEISPQYCAVILRRWVNLTNGEPIRHDGAHWSDLEPTKPPATKPKPTRRKAA